MTSPTTLPPEGYEIISPDTLRKYPNIPGILSRSKTDISLGWFRTEGLPVTESDIERFDHCAPLGTLAALFTPLPEARCECGFDEEWSDDPNPRTECDLDCPLHPRNRLVRVLPGQLKDWKVKPEGLFVANSDPFVRWHPSSRPWPFAFGPYDGLLAYALPQWSYDEVMGRGEDDIDSGEGVRTFGYRLPNPSLEGWNTHQPTHRCNQCGAYWMRRQDETWTLCSPRAGACCDNAHMGSQIIALFAASAMKEGK